MTPIPARFRTRRRGAILALTLVAFWLAQAMALAHASRHVGSDAAGLPADHSMLCTDCASMLPLLSVAGGAGPALALVPGPQPALLPAVEIRLALSSPHRAFRSRAPPR